MIDMTAIHPAWLIGFTVLIALLPVLMGLFTSYVKVSVVLGMLRSGLGVQQAPGNLVVMALSLAITFYVMSPCLSQSARIASSIGWPSLSEAPRADLLPQIAALSGPWRAFMRRHAGVRELKALLLLLCENDRESVRCQEAGHQVETLGTSGEGELSFGVVAAGFVLSELKEAFAMGFVLLLPFLAVDLIVANILAGMGMFMLSPALVSLPLKLLLFFVCDGWLLLTRGLVSSYMQ